MTIKQHGGIFGRNPTFNTITASEFVGPVSGLATTAAALKSSATTGLMQITGPATGATRTMTIPDANFTAARTDAAQSFTGDQTLTDGNLVVSNGKGIDFSATAGTGTSELFDDYEEGTWTPELSFGNGTTGITYDVQSGNYVKIGNSVIISCLIDLSSKGTDTGFAVIRGFPYAVGSDGATGILDTVTGFSGLVAGGATFITISSGTGYIMNQTTTGRDFLYDTNFGNGAYLSFTLCYIAA